MKTRDKSHPGICCPLSICIRRKEKWVFLPMKFFKRTSSETLTCPLNTFPKKSHNWLNSNLRSQKVSSLTSPSHAQVKVWVMFYGMVYSILYSGTWKGMNPSSCLKASSMWSGHSAFALQMNLRDVSLCNNPLMTSKHSKYISECLNLNCTCTLCIIFSFFYGLDAVCWTLKYE